MSEHHPIENNVKYHECSPENKHKNVIFYDEITKSWRFDLDGNNYSNITFCPYCGVILNRMSLAQDKLFIDRRVITIFQKDEQQINYVKNNLLAFIETNIDEMYKHNIITVEQLLIDLGENVADCIKMLYNLQQNKMVGKPGNYYTKKE